MCGQSASGNAKDPSERKQEAVIPLASQKLIKKSLIHQRTEADINTLAYSKQRPTTHRLANISKYTGVSDVRDGSSSGQHRSQCQKEQIKL